MKILIADDHMPMRRLIRAVVGELAQDVVECADGAAAVAAFESRRFGADDWVLMDLDMPGVNGLDATRRIRARSPAARILIVTQCSDDHLRRAAMAAGATGYVRKDDLLVIREYLRPTRQQDGRGSDAEDGVN